MRHLGRILTVSKDRAQPVLNPCPELVEGEPRTYPILTVTVAFVVIPWLTARRV